MQWLPIRYRDFYDFPRAFIVERSGSVYFFDCPFDKRLDDYPDRFRVYRLPSELPAGVETGSWQRLAEAGTFISEVPINRVEFDQTRRSAISDAVFQSLR